MGIDVLDTLGVVRVGVVCDRLPFSVSRYLAVTEDSVLVDFVLAANELGIIVSAIASDNPAEVIRFIIDIVSLHFH